jgi:hypothetical protein
MTDEGDDRDRYLWDRGGEPDREVERLERLLARHRFDARRDALPEAVLAELGSAPLRARSRRMPLALAASILALVAAAVWLAMRDAAAERTTYEVQGLADVERAGAGESLATGPDRSARVVIGSLGSVQVEPGSRLRIEDAGERRHELFLERGAVRASIFARPGEFRIGTPAGLSIDLGCVYELRVDDEGVSHMSVELGRIAFEAAGRRIVVPAGSRSEASERGGVRVPVLEGAPDELVAAIRRLETAEEPDEADLRAIGECDLRRHSVSLWHLYRFAPSRKVVDVLLGRLTQAYPLPEGADDARLVARDAELLDRWQEEVDDDWR